MGCYYQEDACRAMYFILPTGKNTVLLRTALSIKSRPSEWKFKDAITVFVTYCEGCIDLLFFISPKWSSELLSPP